MPKLDQQDVLFQELRAEGSRLLLIAPHSHVVVDTISHLRIVEQKY